MSAKFESQNGSISDGPDDQALEQLLRSLDGVENSFASLTMPDGSYLQAGGGPDEFTVEVRLFPPGLPFRHLKAGMTGGLNNAGERRLSIGGADVLVPLNQVLGFSTVYQLFRHFLHGHGLDPSIEWHDITSMFAATATATATATRGNTDATFACLVPHGRRRSVGPWVQGPRQGKVRAEARATGTARDSVTSEGPRDRPCRTDRRLQVSGFTEGICAT